MWYLLSPLTEEVMLNWMMLELGESCMTVEVGVAMSTL